MKTNLAKKGAAQAAVLSAMLGSVALALVNLGTEISGHFKHYVHALGKWWMPGAEGIGPYSGKQTAALLVWLGSWWLLHLLLRERELRTRFVMPAFLIGMAGATTLLWPPTYEAIAHLFSKS